MAYCDPWANPLLLIVKLAPDVDAAFAAHPGADPRRAGLHHITLLLVGRAQRQWIDQLKAVLAGFRASAFRVCFDIVHSGSKIVAKGSEDMKGALRFQAALRRHLVRGGVDLPKYRFDPHITLNYHAKGRGSCVIDAVSWLVDEICLIESVYGKGRHKLHGRWLLDPPASG